MVSPMAIRSELTIGERSFLLRNTPAAKVTMHSVTPNIGELVSSIRSS